MEDTFWIFPVVFLCVILPLIYSYYHSQYLHVMRMRKHKKGVRPMSEALQRFVGKECAISTATISGSVYTGVVKSVEGGWLTLEASKTGKTQVINTDYISMIGEKKKA